ncbi:cytochrome c peroxidase [Aquamicrobium sp. LC103]|uniref:cytochrome-c peroxidase n=1 Tax=Aquamicrobium sp. LC103 TaxID=1120658 RepID=UPI00069CA82E|nr:cytochrome c peroxidase [Aquamicrobium sp. LC103]
MASRRCDRQDFLAEAFRFGSPQEYRGLLIWILFRTGIALLALAVLAGSGAREHSYSQAPPRHLSEAYRAPPHDWPAALVDADGDFIELGALQLPTHVRSRDPDEARLGRDLFHDRSLSAGNDIACGDCHQESHGWSDGKPAQARRNTPSLFAAAHRRVFSWDGRHETLQAQMLAPLTDRREMANPDLEAVLDRLRSDAVYSWRFRSLYGDEGVNAATLASAFAAFAARIERPTRFDHFVLGNYDALDREEIWGLHLFRTKAGCANCHFGPLLTDDRFHNLGLSAFGEPAEDLGRFAVTGEPDDAGRFRTPSLRHVARTAPYMHNGHFGTLEGVIHFYARGGGEVWARNEAEANRPLHRFASRLSPHLRPLDLSVLERRALAAFLRAI